MAQRTVPLMLLGVGLALLFACPAKSCVKMENLHLTPTAPSSTIKTVEFPDDEVLPVGSNVTILCTSNYSKVDYGYHYFAQPYWIQIYHNDNYKKSCGGRDGSVDSEDSKVCTLFIQNATKEDSGVYDCWSHNQMRCTEDTIKLTFKEPSQPSFTVNPPQEIYVSTGSKVNMSCKASGFPIPVVTWYKNGNPVPKENTNGVKGVSLLTFESMSSLHQGEYWCEGRNSVGWNRSSSTRLSLTRMPSISLHPRNGSSVQLEDNVTVISFSCEATGSPKPVIGWLKNNSTKVSGRVIQTGSISSLILVLLGKEKFPGKYNCFAENSVGKVYSNEATLAFPTKRPHPRAKEAESTQLSFYGHPESITAFPGHDVVFTCAVEGSPVPKITWLKDGVTIMDGKARSFHGKFSATSVLKIFSVENQHGGAYTCQATGPMEKIISKEAMLSITGDTSASTGAVSKGVWISIATAAVLLAMLVILIFVMHNKCKKAVFKINGEANKEQRFLDLRIHEDAISQQPRYSQATAVSSFRMTNTA